MGKSDSQFKLNMPTDLIERIRAAASENTRSITGEIIHALEAAYPAPKTDDVKILLVSALADLVSSLSEQDDEGLIEFAPEMQRARAAIARASEEVS